MTEEKPTRKNRKRKRKVTKRPNTARKTNAVFEVDVEVPTPLTPDPSKGLSRKLAWRRFEAGYTYVTSLDTPTIYALASDERFKDIPISKLKKWAKEDGWEDKRKSMFSQLQEELQRRLRTSLTDTAFQEAQHLMRIRKLSMDHLTKEDDEGNLILKPRSWEGVAKVLMESNKRLDELRRAVAADVAADDEGQGQEAQAVATPTIGNEELEEVAAELLKRRRDKMREELAGSGEKPLKVVES